MDFDELMMKKALDEAKKAEKLGEVPVGAIIVKDKEIIATGYNNKESTLDVLGHAECNAIRSACKFLKSKHLNNTTLYVTLEPCPMCAGAILSANIDKVVIGAMDFENGAMGSIIDLSKITTYGKTKIKNGVLENECQNILTEFFRKIRK